MKENYTPEEEQFYINELKNIPQKWIKSGYYPKYIKYHPDLLEFIIHKTPLLSDPKYTLATKVYWVINGLAEFPKCPICSKELTQNVKSLMEGYQMYCSVKCMANSKEVRETVKATCLEKYGEICPSKNEQIKEKSKQTMLEKYGAEFYSQTDECKDRVKKTCLEKFGVVTNLNLCYHKFNHDDLEKSKQTKYDRYGFKQWNNSELTRKTYAIRRFECVKNDQRVELVDNVNEIYLDTEYNWQCRECGNIFKSKISLNWYANSNHSDHIRCPFCFPDGISSKEQELSLYIRNIYSGSILSHLRKLIPHMEIDLYIPEKKLAIEFDGLYWHSSQNGKPDNYHLLKTIECENRGIHLIHIFENDWLNNLNQVKSKISHLLGVDKINVYARNCSVNEISNEMAENFINCNWIADKNQKCTVNLALLNKNEIISVARFNKNDKDWELVHFVNKMDYNIPGAFSKLMSYFESKFNPFRILVMVDRKWTSEKSNVFLMNGFKLTNILPPSPNYFKSGYHTFESEAKFPKKNAAGNYDYLSIFDCGRLMYVKDIGKNMERLVQEINLN